jgi:hypothetical protein
MWEPQRLTTLQASTDCYRDSFFLFCRYGNKENVTEQTSEIEINKVGSSVSKGNSINIVVWEVHCALPVLTQARSNALPYLPSS